MKANSISKGIVGIRHFILNYKSINSQAIVRPTILVNIYYKKSYIFASKFERVVTRLVYINNKFS